MEISKNVFTEYKRILTDLIVSDEFCAELLPFAKKEYFPKTVAPLLKWIESHFNEYAEAPREEIRTIFEQQSEFLNDDEFTIIHNTLEHLSDYEGTFKGNIALRKNLALHYLKTKNLELTIKAIQDRLANNKVAEAEVLLENHYALEFVLRDEDKPNDEVIKNVILDYWYPENDRATLYVSPGELGAVLGENKRKWLKSYAGPPKRGKTQWLMEEMIDAVKEKKNVLFITLEMSKEELMHRLVLRISGMKNMDYQGKYKLPIFDCERNQQGTCVEDIYEGTALNLDENDLPEYEHDPSHLVCTQCMGSRLFVPAGWWKMVDRKNSNSEMMRKRLDAFNRLYAKRYRIKEFPDGTLNEIGVNHLLHELRRKEDFIPDVIIVDYADRMIPNKTMGEYRHNLDSIWRGLKKIAQENDAEVITATQTNKATFSRDITIEDLAEDSRKAAHVDMMIAINQSKSDKHFNLTRIQPLIHRHNNDLEGKTCTVLQDIKHFQICLTSAIRSES